MGVDYMPDGITYKNKDVMFKVLSQYYENKSFAVYGLNVPKVKRLLPSDYPTVTATEIYPDNVFLLEDNSILVLEYESKVSLKNFLKYTKYIVNVVERLATERDEARRVKVKRVILAVIYTGDVKKATAIFDIGALKVQAEQVFLSRFDTESIYADLKRKVEAKEPLSDDDIMRFIILPLTQPKMEQKQQLIEDTMNLAKQVMDERRQLFIITGILTATDKFVDREYSNSIKEWIRLTKVARLFEEEKIEAVNAAVEEKNRQVVISLLQEGVDIKKIMKATKLTRKQIDKIWKEMNVLSAV